MIQKLGGRRMKLYYSPTSPFARKVRVAIIELELHDQVELIQVDPWSNEDLRSLNPLCKVPTLVLNRKEVLFESVLICEYLNSLREKKSLYPIERVAYFKNMRFQALADGAMTATGRLYAEYQKTEQARSTKMIQRFNDTKQASLQWINQHFSDLSTEPTIGGVSVACFLDYICFRFPEDSWRTEYHLLDQWLSEFKQRDSMKQSAYHR